MTYTLSHQHSMSRWSSERRVDQRLRYPSRAPSHIRVEYLRLVHRSSRQPRREAIAADPLVIVAKDKALRSLALPAPFDVAEGAPPNLVFRE
jgi:hypothetical protein